MTAMSEEEFQALISAVRKGQVRRIRHIILAPMKRFAAFVNALRRGELAVPPPTFPAKASPPLTKEQQRLEGVCACLPEVARAWSATSVAPYHVFATRLAVVHYGWRAYRLGDGWS